MSESNDQDAGKGRLSLRPSGRLELGRTVDAGSVRQSFSHGRSKVVQVEVRKKRAAVGAPGSATPPAGQMQQAPSARGTTAPAPRPAVGAGRALTASELAARQRALVEQQREAARREAERREQEKISILSAAEEARRREEEARKAAEEEARQREEEDRRREAEEAAQQAAEVAAAAQTATSQAAPATARAPEEQRRRPATPAAPKQPTPTETLRLRPGTRAADEDEEARPVRRPGAGAPPRKPPVVAPKKGGDSGRRAGRIDVQAAIEGEDEKVRSLASVRRQRERERRQAELERLRSDQVKVVRDVILPDAITVQELANRMAARAGDVIKTLMKFGVMATVTQSLDADTAE
ncbi:MAG TPA: translation initiation factor IF-2 N-terminal domain-containing protein, partial [Acetobacteraceae bacterium]|nr:translation initiation factor IF-2 N-terminal domain-containing protein [Acetobacteraceae bacterium]